MIRHADGSLVLETPVECAAAWLLWCANRRVVLTLSEAGLLIDTTAADLDPLTEAEFQDVCTQLARPIVQILAGQAAQTVH